MMTPIEIIALIAAVLILVKSLFMIIRPKGLVRFIERMIEKKSGALRIIYLLLFAILAYFILQEMRLVNVLAVFMLCSCLFGIALMDYKKGIHMIYKEAVAKTNWLVILIMASIAVWTLVELFA